MAESEGLMSDGILGPLKEDSKSKHNETTAVCPANRGNKLFLVIYFICRSCLAAFVALMAPFFPTLAVERGVNKPTIGVIFSCYQLAALISATAVGRLISVIGHRFMFVTGLLVTGACSLLFGFLESCPPGAPLIGLSIAIRSIEGIGSTAVSVVGFAVLTGAFPERVAFLSALGVTFHSIGLSAGPAIGGALYQASGFGLPFWSFGILLLLMGCTAFYLPMAVNFQEDSETNEYKQAASYWTLLSEPMVVILLSFMFASTVLLGFLDTTLSLYLKEQFQLGPATASIVFVLMTLCVAIFGPIFGHLGNSETAKYSFLLSGYFSSGVIVFFIGPVPFIPLPRTLWLTVGSILLTHVSISVVVHALPSIFAFLEKQGYRTDDNVQGLVSGLRATALTSGGLVGPVLGGVLTDRFGFPRASGILPLFMFLPSFSLGFYLVYMYCKKKGKQALVDCSSEENVPLMR